VSLTIDQSELAAIVGPSGSGKTTQHFCRAGEPFRMHETRWSNVLAGPATTRSLTRLAMLGGLRLWDHLGRSSHSTCGGGC
jgi:ABC-type phosphate/phosphonate transport system ATPase subunit